MTTYVERLNDIADNYHDADVPDKFIEKIGQEYTLDWLSEKLSGRKRILELGYGDGIINKYLNTAGFPVEVLEGSPKIISKAKSENPNIKVYQALFEEFVCNDPYDCVLAMHVLEHIDDPVELLIKMKTWLLPGGVILIIVPNKNSLHRQLAVEMGLQQELDDLSPRDLIVGHQRVYSHDTLTGDVEAAGYEVLEETGFCLKCLPNGMMLEHSEELIWAMNRISPKIPPTLLANIGMLVRVP